MPDPSPKFILVLSEGEAHLAQRCLIAGIRGSRPVTAKGEDAAAKSLFAKALDLAQDVSSFRAENLTND